MFGVISGGLLGGVRGKSVELRIRPNQGIRRSAQISLTFGLVEMALIIPYIAVGISFLFFDESFETMFANRAIGWSILLPHPMSLICRLPLMYPHLPIASMYISRTVG